MDKISRQKDLTEWSKRHAEAFNPDMSGLRRAEGDTHDWFIEEVDGGPVGIGEFFKCKACEASGSPIYAPDPRTPVPFLADGTGLKLSLNCDEAKMQIEEHNKAQESEGEAQTVSKIETYFTVGDLKKALEGMDDSLPVFVEADSIVDGDIDVLLAKCTGAGFAKAVRQDVPLVLGQPVDHFLISADGVPHGTCRECLHDDGYHAKWCVEHEDEDADENGEE